ncbi:hypothetical protein [Pseudomonas promysalinigenes]|uniref:Uncharacterized protein n=1 Tax=Pseudomonas promysalinigenes TaxID=485898 RepID=A0ABY6APP1_9PSED|nr:hypothetical protein [Pseudomonas promysalinigenes]UXH41611.1 hypothetical protein N5C08_08835 [Pseudomonas promysalinigenes]
MLISKNENPGSMAGTLEALFGQQKTRRGGRVLFVNPQHTQE